MNMNMWNNVLFIALPYVAGTVFVIGCIWRLRSSGYKVSSLSSQFLEGNKLFFGSTAFHWGIVVVFFGHLIAFLFPREMLLWNSHPVRLLILEVTGFAFGLSCLFGLAGLLIRRVSHDRIRAVTTHMDYFIEALLLIQIVLGCWIAFGYRWGASWFASDLSPYLWSLVKFDPQILAVSAMPVVVKLHIVGAFLILLLIPFTRLIHFLAVPLWYIWRPYQLVMWNWDRKSVRDARGEWSKKRPKNN